MDAKAGRARTTETHAQAHTDRQIHICSCVSDGGGVSPAEARTLCGRAKHTGQELEKLK